MTKIARFQNDTRNGLREILCGRQNSYTYSSFDLSDIGQSFKHDIERYRDSKSDYKSEPWFQIDFDNSLLSVLKSDELDFSGNEIPDYIYELLEEDDKNYNFEILCSILFEKLLGSLIIEHRLQSRDGGIDFYGKFTSNSCTIGDVTITDFLNINSWYIGQAKFYNIKNKISTSYLRELIGTIELAKRNIWATNEGHGDFGGIKDFHYMVPLFVTNSYYSRDSYSVAEQFNIKLFDTNDLMFWLSVLFDSNKSELETKFDSEKNR
jgi:hypothetical protein